MPQTPPTVPSSGPAAPRRSRTAFYAAVGCLSVIAGLVLGVGGFFGVRALQDDGGTSVAEGDEGKRTDGSRIEDEPTVLDQAPVGADSAVPFGSTFPITSAALEGEVEVTLTGVDWEATAEIREANSFNEAPQAGNTYLLLTVEGVYRGDGFESYRASGWLHVTYVAADGTPYDEVSMVTPQHEKLIGQQGVAEDGGFLSEHVFEVPEDLEAGGHFVLSGQAGDVRAGAWVEAV